MALLEEANTALHLEPLKRQTATSAVAERLIQQISTGALQPGAQLPTDRELARQLQVGRTTVREALKVLTLNGLLEARRAAELLGCAQGCAGAA